MATTNTHVSSAFNLKSVSLLLLLSVLVVSTGWIVIATLWTLPITMLLATPNQLAIVDLAKQMTIVPTMIVAMMAGGLLGISSLLLQQLVKNPLASDTTLAVGSGAQMALLVVTLFLPSFGLYGNFWVALVGALLSMGLVFLMSLPSRMNPLILVLSGLIINIFVTALSSLFLLFFSEKALGVMTWGGGVLTQISWQGAYLLSMAAVLSALVLMPLLKPLSIMSLDDQQAQGLGVPVNTIRCVVVVLVAMMTALVVSQVGILSFVGLGAATLVNVLSIRHLTMRLLIGFIVGGLLLLLTSNLVLLIMQALPIFVPAGAMTGILGAPLIVWLILRQKKQHVDVATPNLQANRRLFTMRLWLLMIVAVLLLLAMSVLMTQTITGWQISADAELISRFRLPRSLSAAATGVMLATAGVMIQTLTRNPMASPEVLGISSGAAVGVLLCVLLLSALGMPIVLAGLLAAGILGAFAVLLLILWLARSLNPAYLLLVGIAISALMNGILNIIKLSGDPRLQAILSWLSGTTYSARPETVWWLICIAVVMCLAAVLLLQPLRLLGLGSMVARSLGVNVGLAQLAVMIVIAGLSAASTLAVGPLSFVGLMIPHLATSLGATQLHRQLPLAMLLGAALMIVSDWLGRYVIFPYEIPAGTVAAIIGGLYFIVLIRRVRS